MNFDYKASIQYLVFLCFSTTNNKQPTIVDLVDSELCGDEEYSRMENNSLNRVRKLLGKMDTLRRNEERNYTSSDVVKHTSHKFMGRVENIFKKLPKSLKWRSFYENDLQILMDTSEIRKSRLKVVRLKTVRFFLLPTALAYKPALLTAFRLNRFSLLCNADWRDFQGKPAREETWENSILIDDYLSALKKGGWKMTHMIQSPMSSERFNAGVVSVMQKKKILGVTSRYAGG